MAAITICSDFGAQKNKVSHWFHYFPIYLLWTDRTGCHDLSWSMLTNGLKWQASSQPKALRHPTPPCNNRLSPPHHRALQEGPGYNCFLSTPFQLRNTLLWMSSCMITWNLTNSGVIPSRLWTFVFYRISKHSWLRILSWTAQSWLREQQISGPSQEKWQKETIQKAEQKLPRVSTIEQHEGECSYWCFQTPSWPITWPHRTKY